MAAGGLLQLWTEWSIQILVLVSFFLQVLLLLIGGMRRRGLSAWQRVVLWFAYLLADSTAIYALGHLSITSESREHRLVAFWAPFLLLHLGGPHNITAYALEDNRLWLRHLQTLVVQALGAAYVLYKYMAGSGTYLMLASVSMFIAGLAKYGERTWALRCANKSSRSSSSSSSSSAGGAKPVEEVNCCRLLRRQDMGDQEMLLVRAHTQFPICRSLFNDTKVGMRAVRSPDNAGLSPYKDEDTFKLLEMELSLMYDILYTKAPVIHTWYGICIHFISLLGTSVALCLFQFSRRGSPNHQAGQGYSMPDVVISYVLLAGALVLEAMSACRAVLSSRTCSFILCKAENYPRACAWLRWLHSSLRKPFKPASRRLWRDTMGQYNLLHLSTRHKTDLGSKLAAKLGLQDWWNKLHFSGTFSGTDSLPMRRLKELLEETVRRQGLAYHSVLPLSVSLWRGRSVLSNNHAFKGVARWTVQNIEFDESIVIWHVATDIFISEFTTAAGHNYDIQLVEATRVLSNYMMFLLVAKPSMLPGRERHNVHMRTSRGIETCWRDYVLCDEDNPVVRASCGSCWWNKCCMLMELFHREGPDCSSGISEKLAEALCRGWTPEQGESTDQTPESLNIYLGESLDTGASHLAKQLLNLGRPDTLELIFAVWVEIMLYAAEHGPRDSHARELGNGGEFMTIVWLLVQHYNYLHRNKIA